MSLKNDIEMVKDELNSEEKFFEKAVMTEKFVKKYKNIMIASVVAIVVFAGGNIAYTNAKESKIESANMAFTLLEKNPQDKTQQAQLKELSPALYDVWLYSNISANKELKVLEKLANTKAPIIKDLVSYEKAQNNSEKLVAYTLKQNAIYKDLAQVQLAVIFINNNKIDEAHEKLLTISENSPLYKVAKSLLHYGVK